LKEKKNEVRKNQWGLSESVYNEPINSKLWIFYFNKNDMVIFPAKRYKYFGCAINITNPISIVANLSLVIVNDLLA
jgi:uncharacterized membrane protein